MAELAELSASDRAFLAPYLPPGSQLDRSKDAAGQAHATSSGKDSTLPFVTLTYASSLDGMISLAPGLRTTLSAPETKSMTHYLRLHHDAILVGVGTAIPDDPSLNCRYPGASFDSQPRPVILDPRQRWDVKSSKLTQLVAAGKGKVPWLVHAESGQESRDTDETGCERLYVEADQGEASIAWPTILRTLKQRGINSVMIEGGATIIATLLTMPELVDSVIVTVAPTWLGQGGVSIAPAARVEAEGRVNAATLQNTTWRQFGADAVLCGRMR
ncbi:hypothetical protein LTS10_009259 [Elasticomyces elasticus]|nr:hypothetical protein LTS10_009259 [Elasticomyces elasticus]